MEGKTSSEGKQTGGGGGGGQVPGEGIKPSDQGKEEDEKRDRSNLRCWKAAGAGSIPGSVRRARQCGWCLFQMGHKVPVCVCVRWDERR